MSVHGVRRTLPQGFRLQAEADNASSPRPIPSGLLVRSLVKKEIGRELQQMYDGLPPDKQKEFRDYTAARFGDRWLKDYLPK